MSSIDSLHPIYPSIYDGEKISVRCILHFSCKTCSAQLERGHYSCLQCLSRECMKCALMHSSSPEEAKHCMRSDFTTRYIGAYYRSEGLPGILPLRASAGTLNNFGSIMKYKPRLENSWRDVGRKLEDRRRFRPFAMLHDLAFLSLRYRGPAAWEKLVRVE